MSDACDFAAAMGELEAESPLSSAPIRNGGIEAPRRSGKPQLKKASKTVVKSAFEENNPGIVEFLRANTWSDFFQSLLAGYERYGSLTEKQTVSVRNAMAKITEKKAAVVAVDLSTIKAMFDNAVTSGLKRTKYRAEGLELTRAPDHGRNAGAIYVKRTDDGEYLGKVVAGVFQPVRAAGNDDKAALLKIAADPREAAVKWGKKTGTCSCCGRELTNKTSIALGIGPICAEKWGL